MESWRRVFRVGFAPHLGRPGLLALLDALRRDAWELLQGGTTTPPPLTCVADWNVEQACPVTLAGWKGHGKATVGEAQAYFAEACRAADRAVGEPAGCRFFTNFVDETERQEMIRLLTPEVLFSLGEGPDPCAEAGCGAASA